MQKGNAILIILLIMFISLTAASVFAADQSGFLDQKIKKPIVQAFENYKKGIEEKERIAEEIRMLELLEATASANASPNPSVTRNSGYSQVEFMYDYGEDYYSKPANETYSYPEFKFSAPSYSSPGYTPKSFPTPAPGELGSPEWKAQFDKDYAETKKRIEDNRKEMCEKNPSFSMCN